MPYDTLSTYYVPLSVLEEWPANPSDHALDVIESSIDRFGFLDPMGVREEGRRIIEGHGRRKVLVKKREEGEAPPRNVFSHETLPADKKTAFQDARSVENDWYVPVLFLDFNSESEAEAYLLAHNQSTRRGRFDEERLAGMLEEHVTDLDGIGFSEDEAVSLIEASEEWGQTDPVDYETDTELDHLPEPLQTGIQEGDISQGVKQSLNDLPPRLQEQAAEHYEEEGRITGADVRNIRINPGDDESSSSDSGLTFNITGDEKEVVMDALSDVRDAFGLRDLDTALVRLCRSAETEDLD